MFQGFLTQSLEKLNGLRCSPAQNIMTANKSAPQTAGSLTVICRGPSDFTVNFFTWLKYHDSYVPRIGWSLMTQYFSYFIEKTTLVHFVKGSSSKYCAIILIQTKINYFACVSSILIKKVEKKKEKHKIENKVQLNTGGRSTKSFDSLKYHYTQASHPHPSYKSSGWFSVQPQPIWFQDAEGRQYFEIQDKWKEYSNV